MEDAAARPTGSDKEQMAAAAPENAAPNAPSARRLSSRHQQHSAPAAGDADAPAARPPSVPAGSFSVGTKKKGADGASTWEVGPNKVKVQRAGQAGIPSAGKNWWDCSTTWNYEDRGHAWHWHSGPVEGPSPPPTPILKKQEKKAEALKAAEAKEAAAAAAAAAERKKAKRAAEEAEFAKAKSAKLETEERERAERSKRQIERMLAAQKERDAAVRERDAVMRERDTAQHLTQCAFGDEEALGKIDETEQLESLRESVANGLACIDARIAALQQHEQQQ
jgi:hypothetical protein